MLQRVLEKDASVGVDLTPVIDVVFLLLIFFLVATTFHQSEREMQITLPESRSGGPIALSLRELVVNVTADGAYIVAGRTIDEEALCAIVRERVASNPDQKVTIRGDRTASYGAVARALDLCKHAGVRDPFLDTVPRP